MVSDYFLPRLGGIELHMRDLSRRLIAEGCEVEIHTTIPGPDIVDGIAVHRTPALLAPRFGFAVSPGLVGLIGRELARGRYDVLHAHLSIVSPLSCAAIVAARQLQLPVVATFHSIMGRAGWGLKDLFCNGFRGIAARTSIHQRPQRDAQIDFASRRPFQLQAGAARQKA